MRKAGILFVFGALAACQTDGQTTLGIGEGLRHDDFVYSVRRVTVADSTSRLNRAAPENRLWLVIFRVENQAKQGAHPWSDRTAFVTDSAGNQYEPMTRPSAGPRLTAAGQTDSTTLLFSLPKTLTKPYLQVRRETLMGDVLDGGRSKTKIRLF